MNERHNSWCLETAVPLIYCRLVVRNTLGIIIIALVHGGLARGSIMSSWGSL